MKTITKILNDKASRPFNKNGRKRFWVYIVDLMDASTIHLPK